MGCIAVSYSLQTGCPFSYIKDMITVICRKSPLLTSIFIFILSYFFMLITFHPCVVFSPTNLFLSLLLLASDSHFFSLIVSTQQRKKNKQNKNPRILIRFNKCSHVNFKSTCWWHLCLYMYNGVFVFDLVTCPPFRVLITFSLIRLFTEHKYLFLKCLMNT